MESEILFFFDGHLQALPVYEQLETRIFSEIPDVGIKCSKTQLTFYNRHGFAFVSFLPCRKAKDRPDAWLTVSFGLGHRVTSARIDAASEPYPGRWTHHVMVSRPEEVDEELMGWIREAAAFSANK